MSPNNFKMKRNTFDWSLKPLMFAMRLVIGCNLKDAKRENVVVRFFVPALGLFYIIAHFIVNGPCALFSETAYFNSFKVVENENPLAIIPIDREDVLHFVFDSVKLTTFSLTLLIHLIFMANLLLTKKWNYLWKILQKIQTQMKLDDEFHKKLRRRCLVAFSIFILVTFLLYFSH